MDDNSKSLYIESLQDLKHISNFEEIKEGDLIIFFPLHINDGTFVDPKNLVHYNIIILPLDIFLHNGFKTLIINRTTYSINCLASESKCCNECPISENIILLNHHSQDKYLILKANYHDSIEVIDLAPSSKYYICKVFLFLYYIIVVICLFLYLYNKFM